MSDQENQNSSENVSRQEHVDRCLSMIMHFEEIQLIANVIKEILKEQDHAGRPWAEN